MKCILVENTGGPDVMQTASVDTPDIEKDTQVRVRLMAAGVNPVDTKLRAGIYPYSELPAIPGCDGAGIIDKVGKAVSHLSEGNEVYFFHGGLGGKTGNYAEYIVLDERFVARKPSSIDFNQAAAAPLVLLTAWEALFDRARLQEDNTVLIHAGAGGVGHIAIQLAKQAGARVCTTISSEEKAEFVRKLGADHVINYRQQDFVEKVLEWTDGKGVDIAMDNVGGELVETTFPAVKPYGDIVTLLQPAKDTDWSVARQRNLRLGFEVMLSPLVLELEDAQRHQTDILNQVADLIDQHQLKIHVSKTLPLDEAVAAHKLIETGSTTGKIVLTVP
ncbi:MAG TPA: zinc-dependent alcohol dehydrogenase family protein [Gammaproteobacteria bacterium]|nr:zinc-dependent alcohol dehydrogenase family protein [Gammaproteobacteria bacterium]